LNIANVTSRFALLAGLDNSEIYKWKDIVDDACRYVESLVIKENPDSSDTVRIETLCAVYALRLYCLCNDENIASFTAGDVQITSSADKQSKAQRLWNEYLQQSEDLVGRQDFLFGRVM
jgi:hypothetical protein